ncbi:glyoxylase-like metal-dependent hydrolase (beta-lactamase superfamily II) [Bacillus pakistanensis]|uniref:Glyoxylase-like metal-dependent hydrolase (Beta-lactamase superfamily II) n=1 Tax=Rossellomorea pakistanensis TaxID=992288 RepID=A0ABS2NB03_9BACI|nr:MBL fold metallo-hydrolase [Bacillus pakistanensis]MBM7585027.1 glyoxylase-like metal-dependent hydrolase (beta-lactamase superfamily II) [Bacillus pakistanensis]
METVKIGEQTLTWLKGGVTHMDGGAMFGVVPKPLWSKKYPHNESNQIELRTDPIYLNLQGKNILIESGIGNGKFSDKQKRNYGVLEESEMESSLKQIGLTTSDIDIILMTHMHFDHACGLTTFENNKWKSVFPNAVIYTSQTEWDEMRAPNIRSRNTYWKENWEAIEHQVQPFKEEIEVLDGLKMIHTGGHSNGHSIIVYENGEDHYIHMADLMPTHAHKNPLWVLAYDDYPMDSIDAKQQWISKAIEENYWFIFYHDAKYRALKWDKEGEIVSSVLREK